ncbi:MULTISPECIES: AraC family transcriptional regulator [unclassified Coleofasciculus]|uniref:AraC family transcriptional regulator n=1 Tax=unclassified Coleofasciculus TaxID=2692782 RepID=UPI00188123CC|nr:MULTISPECIES: AraC family transcriptional regulator [unclassified Coleofasciculus]MBE9128373.1 helix-turn-helix transcriptional regulator [Coleofasciculus sp. LEGE 07081]MBE9151429.1 helix-turn-helix transcriptional regulator [Coleofasciculus sp. LEGE 07092]
MNQTMQTQSYTLDLSKEKALSQAVPIPSLLSSHSAQWQGMYLEFHRLPSFEVPESTCQQHLITIPTVNGLAVEQRIEGKKSDLIFHPGDLCISPMGKTWQCRWDEELEAIQLSFEPNFINHAAHELIDPDQFELVCYPQITDPLIYHLGIALKGELERNGSGSKLYAESAATFLAVHLLRNYTARKPKCKWHTGGLSPCQFKQAMDYINAHLAEDICLDEVAGYLGLSRYYFCRLFKQSTGLSPYQYVIQCRVERAKQLLRKGGLSLGEIAVDCGFSHQSHLHRHFKRLTGVTPTRFINS